MKIVRVRLKQEFGNNRYYPKNEGARIACSFARCKSLTKTQLEWLKTLGLKVEVEYVSTTIVQENIEIKEL